MAELEPIAATLPPSFASMTMGGAVRAVMRRDPDKPAVIHGEQVLTYGQLVDRSNRLRDLCLTAFGLGRGDIAAIIARNCIEYFEIVCGVPDSGAAVATVNPRLAPGEIKAVIDDAKAKVIFTDTGSAPAVAAAGLDPSIRIIQIGPEYEALLANAETPETIPEIFEWDVWTIPYTSGTTGKPKGVLLSHRSRMLVGLISSSEFGCFGPEDKFLAMSPMNHGGGLGFPAATLSTGGTVEILDKFEPETTLERLKNGGVTGIFMVPTHFQMIFDLPAETLEKYRLPPIKTIISNAAPLPQAMKEKIVPYFGETVLNEIYSSTEAGLVCNLRPHLQLKTERCVGVPMAHVNIRILDDEGQDCGPDQVGELFTLSPMHFNGYWNRPQETQDAFKGRWMSVGDMAKRDRQGLIYIVDRKKDMVISGGVNIYPREIEEALLRHPAIADVAVVGVPDDRWGERLRTFAVLKPDTSLSEGEMVDFLTGKLATYKIPKELRLIEALPRNANGKVLKTTLRRL